MIKNKKHWIHSGWSIGIGTTMISLLLTMLYDYLKKEPIWTTIWRILKGISHFILAFLNYDLKVWWILISVILLSFFLILIKKFKRERILKPDFYNYKEDQFNRWKWKWEWSWDNNKKAWKIINLKAQCPKCATPMVEHPSIYGSAFDCPRCEYLSNDGLSDQPYKIEQIIFDNIERSRVSKR
jgi:ribosomal protein S27AE